MLKILALGWPKNLEFDNLGKKKAGIWDILKFLLNFVQKS